MLLLLLTVAIREVTETLCSLTILARYDAKIRGGPSDTFFSKTVSKPA